MRSLISLPTDAGRDRKTPPTMIVIHAMAEYLEVDGKVLHARDFLNHIGLSCHYMVTPGGDTIQCADPTTRTTWHSKGYNSDSIGIEILVPGLMNYTKFKYRLGWSNWCSDTQFTGAIDLCKSLRSIYPIDTVVRHSDLDPDRKVDPGRMFNWSLFLESLDQA